MNYKPKKVYERVYIHAAKVQTKEDWDLIDTYIRDSKARQAYTV